MAPGVPSCCSTVGANPLVNGSPAAKPTNPSPVLGFRPVTIDYELLAVVDVARKALEQKIVPERKLPIGAQVVVKEVTGELETPGSPAHYSIILYSTFDKETFYQVAVTVNPKQAPSVNSLEQLPHTYLVKLQERASKHHEITHDVTKMTTEEKRAYEFALKQLDKKLNVLEQKRAYLVKAEILPDINFMQTKWQFTFEVESPLVGFNETWQVVDITSIFNLGVQLVSIEICDEKKAAKPSQSGEFSPVPITLPLDPALNRATLFAVNAVLKAEGASQGVLVKIETAERQVTEGFKWRLRLTLSTAPRAIDQTYEVVVSQALDHSFKLSSYKKLEKSFGSDVLTSEYYLSFFANLAINFSVAEVSRLKKDELRLVSVLGVGEIEGVEDAPLWVLKLRLGYLPQTSELAEFMGEAKVATDYTRTPPLKFLSWNEMHQSLGTSHNEGGFKSVNVDLPGVKKAADFATSALSEILTGLPARTTLSAVDSAAQQVVSGDNWRLKLEVVVAEYWSLPGGTPGPVISPTPIEVLVYQSAQHEYKLVSWKILADTSAINDAKAEGSRHVCT